ncbi:MAG: hypothetical protein ACFE8G_13090 [Candidatus Hermodarchaeota archaeon]
MAVESYSGFIQKHNMLFGILICALLTSILFSIIPSGFFFIADIFLVIGNCIGLYITFRNRKKSQSHIKTGIIVGVAGSVLALLLLGFFDWILYSINYGFDFILFLQYAIVLFGYYGIMYVLVGIILGYLFGYFYRKNEDIDKESPLF